MRGSPRPLKKLAPAGSVYFFKAERWDVSKFERFYRDCHLGKSVSEEYPDAGFGIAMIGVWPADRVGNQEKEGI